MPSISFKIGDAFPADDPVYADWIAMFGNAGYDALVAETTGLLDRLADPADLRQQSRLSEVFRISIRYEGAFWDMAHAAGTAADTAAAPQEGES